MDNKIYTHKYIHIFWMGVFLTDKFSLLHFATGIVVYYWGMSFLTWFVLHMWFEWFENTNYGMKIINKITLWPGGKEHADAPLNSVGDQLYSSIGWIVAYIVCGGTTLE